MVLRRYGFHWASEIIIIFCTIIPHERTSRWRSSSYQGLPGRNLLPLIQDGKPLDRTYLCGESFSHDVADLKNHETSLQYRWCIEGKWKLILSYDCPTDRYAFVHAINDRNPQLFDIESDPREMQNLAVQHPDEVRRLAARLQETWHIPKPAIGLP